MKAWRISLLLSALLLIAALLHHQKREKELTVKLRKLSSLESIQAGRSERSSSSSKTSRSGATSSSSSRIAHLRQLAGAPLDRETISAILSREAEAYNVETWHEMFLMFVNRDQAEIAAFLEEIRDSDFQHMSRLEAILDRLFPDTGPLESRIEASLEKKTHDYLRFFQEWLSSDPDAAKRWIDQQLKTGEIEGKGLNHDPLGQMLTLVATKMALKSPAEMETYYNQIPERLKYRAAQLIAADVARSEPEKIETFFALSTDPKIRKTVIEGIVSAQRQSGKSKDEIFSDTGNLSLTPDDSTALIQSIVGRSEFFEGENLQGRLDWLREKSGSPDLDAYHWSIVNGAYSDHREELESWGNQIEDPNSRNSLFQVLTWQTAHRREDVGRTAAYLSEINDVESRRETYQRIAPYIRGASAKEFEKHLTEKGIDPSSLKQD